MLTRHLGRSQGGRTAKCRAVEAGKFFNLIGGVRRWRCYLLAAGIAELHVGWVVSVSGWRPARRLRLARSLASRSLPRSFILSATSARPPIFVREYVLEYGGIFWSSFFCFLVYQATYLPHAPSDNKPRKDHWC